MTNLPLEVKNALSDIAKDGLTPNMFIEIWNKSSKFLVDGTLKYDLQKIDELVFTKYRDYYDRVNEFLSSTVVSYDSIQHLEEYIKLFLAKIYDCDTNIEAPEFLDNETKMIIGEASFKNAVIMEDINLSYTPCHHCYGRIHSIPFEVIVTGTCYRKEEYHDQFRKSKFRMVEYVCADTLCVLESKKNQILFMFKKIAEVFGFENYQVVIANDSFLTDDPIKIAYQYLRKSKVELQVYIESYGKYVAFMSVNMHFDFFSRKFGFKDSSGNFINSMCLGFGIDRIYEAMNDCNTYVPNK